MLYKDDNTSSQDYELISKEYYDLLIKERIELLNKVLPLVRKRVQIARDLGDLSENGEYQSELNKKIIYEQRLDKINNIINTALVFDVNNYITNRDTIHIGAHITILNMQDNSEFNCQIVGAIESNYSLNKISHKSEIAKLVIGKKVSDIIELRGRKFKIVKIKYD